MRLARQCTAHASSGFQAALHAAGALDWSGFMYSSNLADCCSRIALADAAALVALWSPSGCCSRRIVFGIALADAADVLFFRSTLAVAAAPSKVCLHSTWWRTLCSRALCGCRTPASLWHARDWQMGSLLYLCFVLFQPVEGWQVSPSALKMAPSWACR